MKDQGTFQGITHASSYHDESLYSSTHTTSKRADMQSRAKPRTEAHTYDRQPHPFDPARSSAFIHLTVHDASAPTLQAHHPPVASSTSRVVHVSRSSSAIVREVWALLLYRAHSTIVIRVGAWSRTFIFIACGRHVVVSVVVWVARIVVGKHRVYDVRVWPFCLFVIVVALRCTWMSVGCGGEDLRNMDLYSFMGEVQCCCCCRDALLRAASK
jgi:hypothetical protein